MVAIKESPSLTQMNFALFLNPYIMQRMYRYTSEILSIDAQYMLLTSQSIPTGCTIDKTIDRNSFHENHLNAMRWPFLFSGKK